MAAGVALQRLNQMDFAQNNAPFTETGEPSSTTFLNFPLIHINQPEKHR